MLEFCLLRHGKTYGNTLGRYIGTTDEALCQEGRQRIREGVYPEAQAVYVSPMKRCLETAELIYPAIVPKTEPLLRECDFGEFENKNYLELSGNQKYQTWVDSKGAMPFPGGESPADFMERCREGFRRIVEREYREGQSPGSEWEMPEKNIGAGRTKADCLRQVALVVHGGTIMSILSAFADETKGFYHWQVKNGEGFCARLDEDAYEKRDEVRLYEIHAVSPFAGISS